MLKLDAATRSIIGEQKATLLISSPESQGGYDELDVSGVPIRYASIVRRPRRIEKPS